MLSGIRLSISHFCSTACSVENIGNAVNTASATVISGTSAMVVVKVRLLAVRPNWSLEKRSRSVCAVLFQGKCDKSFSAVFSAISRRARRLTGATVATIGTAIGMALEGCRCGTGGMELMAAMMPLQ